MEKIGARVLLSIILFSISCSVAYATDPTQLQDFCIATNDLKSVLFVNGLFCKNPMEATAEDFFFEGFNIPRDTNNRFGSNVTLLSASTIPDLNTLGISIARVDYAPYGLNPLHIHPRGTELQTVLKGKLLVGFVTSNRPDGSNQFFTKVLKEGDVFVFPQGLIHFQLNIGHTPAVAISQLSSQNPGLTTIAHAVFGSNPPIPVDVLTKAFQANKNVVNYLLSQFQKY